MFYTIRLTFVFTIVIQLSSYGQAYMGYLKKESILTDSSNTLLEVVKKGEAVFIHSILPKSQYYYVNHISTDKEGFILAKNVYLFEEAIEDAETAFSSVKESDKKDPIIRVHNSTHSIMKLRIENKKYEIAPKSYTNVSVKKGKHSFIVTAPDMHPHFGKAILEEFKMYEWEFYID